MANVSDLYGSSVAAGAMDEIHRLGLPSAGQFPYALQGFDPAAVVRRLAAARPDVVFVSAYVDDGVALRREMVRQHLKLVANIGSSSSYCMPEFGERLGQDAVGVFASDKPDAESINPTGLAPAAVALLRRANATYRARFGVDMNAPAPAPKDGPAGRRGGRRPQVTMGKGSIDWVKTFTAARTGGVKNYFVEQSWELTQQSVAYLRTFKV